jgi:2-alkyl-3-oxoalkanoate reductase
VRRRRFPLVGDGGGIFSFVHLDDAAAATVLAVDRGEPGVYNVVDDDPAPVREWLPALAEAVGAKPPRRVPPVGGAPGRRRGRRRPHEESRGASNAKAKRVLGWRLWYPSWREGFRTAYVEEEAARTA